MSLLGRSSQKVAFLSPLVASPPATARPAMLVADGRCLPSSPAERWLTLMVASRTAAVNVSCRGPFLAVDVLPAPCRLLLRLLGKSDECLRRVLLVGLSTSVVPDPHLSLPPTPPPPPVAANSANRSGVTTVVTDLDRTISGAVSRRRGTGFAAAAAAIPLPP